MCKLETLEGSLANKGGLYLRVARKSEATRSASADAKEAADQLPGTKKGLLLLLNCTEKWVLWACLEARAYLSQLFLADATL